MQRHIILTLGRSGSNTLQDMLNQSPQVLNFGEVLGEWNWIRKVQRKGLLLPSNDQEFLNFVIYSPRFVWLANAVRSTRKRIRGDSQAAKSFKQIKTYGIKEFSLNFKQYGLQDYLLEQSDLKVVGLVRENILDRMISNAMLHQTGVVLVRQDADRSDRKIFIDPARIVDLLSDIETENVQLRRMLEQVPEDRVRTISYDELFKDSRTQQRIMREVFQFLGVDPVTVHARMSKIIKLPVDQLIENFDECLKAVDGSKYEPLLLSASSRHQL